MPETQTSVLQPEEPSSEYVFEEPRRLSHSRLWQLQRRFFELKGHAAWGEHIVPSYITTNPFIANSYAQVIMGLLRDARRASPPLGPLDPDEPLYIVELGSGAGRLSFNIVKSLTDSLAQSALRGARVQYILTDLAEKNLEFWANHPALRRWLDAGLLDYARFDAEHPAPLELRHSGKVLAPGAVNPLVLVANYFFDSIPQDAFYIADGRLAESLLKLTLPAPEAALDDPDLFKRVTLVYRRQPLDSSDYYADPEFNRILKAYRQELNGTALHFPNVALECIRFFRTLGRDRLLLLTGDKGYHRAEDLAVREEPGYAVHGSFSMLVNYHAIGRYFENAGGEVWATSYRHAGLDILAMLLYGQPTDRLETRHAFYESMEKRGPDDFFTIGQGLEAHLASLDLEQLLALLRFSGWDSHLFFKCFPTLLQLAPAASERLKEELELAIAQLWDHFYYIGEESDLPFDLGMLLFKLGKHAEALRFFDLSLELYGPAASTYYNQAVCLYKLERGADALPAAERALELEPDMESAAKLRAAILKRMNDNPA